ncbi:MAG: ABC transporter permease, partial [Ignavibacteriaceae bacterium]
MEAKNLLKVALKSILKSRMRSLLTALGIIIGVAAVIVMVAIGNGAQKKVEDQIASLGSNLIVIFPGSINSGGVRMGAGSINRFTMKDVEKIREEATLLKGVTPIVRTGGQVIGGSGNWNTRIEGVSTNYLEISNWSLSSGEFFTEKDMISRAKVAVLGKTVADQLFPNDDPIGQQIRIRNVPFRVIGVLAPKGQNVMGADNDDIIIAPATTVLDRLLGGRYISFIMASASSLSQIDQAQAQLVEIMRKAHNLNPGED